MRMRKKKNCDARMESCADIWVKNPEDNKGRWHEIFGNNNAVHIEIGCGKGGFVTGMAKLHPNTNFIAVEKVSNVIITACESAKAEGLKNVHFINCPAEVLPRYIPEGSIERIYLNFSDPVPKLGYAAQRLTAPRFLSLYKNILKAGGEIWQKTDNEDFFDFSLEMYSQCGYSVLQVCRDLAANPFEGNVVTEHEKKFMDEGRTIFRAVVRRPD